LYHIKIRLASDVFGRATVILRRSIQAIHSLLDTFVLLECSVLPLDKRIYQEE